MAIIELGLLFTRSGLTHPGLFNGETEGMPSQNTTVRRLKIAVLPLDLPCSGLVTHSGEILNTGKSHKKRPDGLFAKDDTEMKRYYNLFYYVLP